MARIGRSATHMRGCLVSDRPMGRAIVSDREIGFKANKQGSPAPGAWAVAPAIRDLRSAIELMREKGLRVSAARRLVVEALLAADGPMSAEQIAEGIGGRVPSSDIGSGYPDLQATQGNKLRPPRQL